MRRETVEARLIYIWPRFVINRKMRAEEEDACRRGLSPQKTCCARAGVREVRETRTSTGVTPVVRDEGTRGWKDVRGF
jgi:hypothetical protein